MTRRLFVMAISSTAWTARGSAQSASQSSNELRFSLRSEPKTFNPLLVTEEASETIRYLTVGVLIRINSSTQKLAPELAVSWKVL